jgi:hypothetical protein
MGGRLAVDMMMACFVLRKLGIGSFFEKQRQRVIIRSFSVGKEQIKGRSLV